MNVDEIKALVRRYLEACQKKRQIEDEIEKRCRKLDLDAMHGVRALLEALGYYSLMGKWPGKPKPERYFCLVPESRRAK